MLCKIQQLKDELIVTQTEGNREEYGQMMCWSGVTREIKGVMASNRCVKDGSYQNRISKIGTHRVTKSKMLLFDKLTLEFRSICTSICTFSSYALPFKESTLYIYTA